MNSPTTRHASPAANPRTGRGPSAPPCHHTLPFAALPHELRKDPRLKRHRTAVVLAAALLEYARDSPHCWPSNRRLAEDLGVCQQTVRNALAALQAAGWCRVEHGVGNPTGRLIWLCWRAAPVRATPPNQLDHPLQPVGGTPLKPVGPEARSVIVEPREEPDTGAGARSRPEIPSTSVTPREQPVPIAEALPPAPPTPAPRPESEPALLPDCRCEPPAPPPAEIRTRPQPEPPARLAVPGPGVARPAFRIPPDGSSADSRPEPAPGREKALPLTPEEKSRLEAMDAGVRDQILTWLMLGDPILMREARAKLTPPRPKPAAPTTLAGLLTRIREDPSYPGLAAAWLSRELGDPKSYSGFLARCREAWQGSLPVSVLQDAYRQATNPKARCPGALFMTTCKRRE